VSELSGELEKESFGVVCLTPSNLHAPWILFEAGALSKSVGDSQVAPFLVGVKPSELPAPLTQFNAVLAEKEDFKRLVKSINDRNSADPVSHETIERSVDACWPEIDTELKKAIENQPKEAKREVNARELEIERFDAILQELLVLNRAQSKSLSTPEDILPPSYLESLLRTDKDSGFDHPAWRDVVKGTELIKDRLNSDGQVGAGLEDAITLLERGVEYLQRRYGRGERRNYFAAARARTRSAPERADPQGVDGESGQQES
jgi:hypothetical protein